VTFPQGPNPLVRPKLQQAIILHQQGKLDDAAVLYAEILKIAPAHFDSLHLLGVVEIARGNLDEAARLIGKALQVEKRDPAAHGNFGMLLWKQKRAEDALGSFTRAINLKPDYVDAHYNRASLFLELKRYEQAISGLRKTLSLKPDHAQAHMNLGVALHETGDDQAAVVHHTRALELNPRYAEAHWNRALPLLVQGKFAEGWADYEWRWQCPDFRSKPRPFSQPQWRGEDIGAGKLLVWGEQGLGDEILYGSLVGELIARDMHVVWEADQRLVPLLQRSHPSVEVIGRADPPHTATTAPDIKAHIPLASLGQHFRKDTASFSAQRRSYLKADEARVRALRDQCNLRPGQRLIGLSWSSTNPDFGQHKSARLEDFSPLMAATGDAVRYVDLQYGDTGAARAAAGLDLLHLDGLDLFNDVDGVAALVAGCDEVVTVSNTTAHIAGALGVPVRVMMSRNAGKLWHWGTEESGSPWYPSAKIYKQQTAGDWAGVVARITADLGPLKA
jgi:Flp pilus assembly protein TadD